MFKIKKSAAHILKAFPVLFNIPNESGSVTKTTRHFDFLVMSQTEIDAAIEAGDDIAKKAVVGWNDIKDEADKVLEFSDTALNELLEMKFARAALMETYFKAISGEKPKRGN